MGGPGWEGVLRRLDLVLLHHAYLSPRSPLYLRLRGLDLGGAARGGGVAPDADHLEELLQREKHGAEHRLSVGCGCGSSRVLLRVGR